MNNKIIFGNMAIWLFGNLAIELPRESPPHNPSSHHHRTNFLRLQNRRGYFGRQHFDRRYFDRQSHFPGRHPVFLVLPPVCHIRRVVS